MSITRCRWALGCICIEALLLAGAAGAAQEAAKKPAAGPEATLVQLELPLARKEQLYLILDPPRATLEIKARGMTLESVRLNGFTLLQFQSAREASVPAPVPLPAMWTVVEEAPAPHRRLIAPAGLAPFPENEEEAESSQPPAAAAEEIAPPPPSVYQVELDGGWILSLDQKPPAYTFWQRWRYAFDDGWQRLRGRPPETPNLLALTLDVEAARRLHHLLRPGMALVVANGPFGSAVPAQPAVPEATSPP